MVLDQTTAFFTGTRESEALATLAERIRQHVASGAKMLGQALAWRDGRWTQWLPPRELRAVRMLFVMMRRCSLRDAYKAQKPRLENLDAFIATYRAETTEGLVPLSVASWAHGVTALLPRTDVIAMSRSLTDTRVVPFEDALRLFGDHLQEVPDLGRHATRSAPFPATRSSPPFRRRASPTRCPGSKTRPTPAPSRCPRRTSARGRRS